MTCFVGRAAADCCLCVSAAAFSSSSQHLSFLVFPLTSLSQSVSLGHITQCKQPIIIGQFPSSFCLSVCLLLTSVYYGITEKCTRLIRESIWGGGSSGLKEPCSEWMGVQILPRIWADLLGREMGRHIVMYREKVTCQWLNIWTHLQLALHSYHTQRTSSFSAARGGDTSCSQNTLSSHVDVVLAAMFRLLSHWKYLFWNSSSSVSFARKFLVWAV